MEAPRILRRPEVCTRAGFRPTTLHELVKAGKFPRPFAITGRSVGWLESEVSAWILQRVKEARHG